VSYLCKFWGTFGKIKFKYNIVLTIGTKDIKHTKGKKKVWSRICSEHITVE